MKKYEYKVSVIVPIYNTENYLPECIESLVTQTINQQELEILLINDGSTDESLNICKEYAQQFKNIKVITQENAGCSAARNLGIRMAKGKYIMYLDSDDTLTINTIKNVTDFFDKHYEEVDMVTYYDQYYKDNKPLKPHIRYNYLQKTGVYDLQKIIHILQVRLNICVKNRFEKNILFDTTMSYQEDQKYCCHILKDKLKIGYCKEGQYNYNKNETGIVGTQTHAFYMFEQSTKYFEDLFNMFTEVPQYYQSLFIHDISWKLSQHVWLPYHYSEEQFSNAMKRIVCLLKKVDVETILNHPSTDKFHKYYFLKLRSKDEFSVVADKMDIGLYYKDKIIEKTSNLEVILSKFLIRNNKIYILAYVKSVLFNFIDVKPKVYAKIDKNKEKLIVPLETYLASDSYYKAKEITNNFWAFSLEHELNDTEQIQFEVEIDGIIYKTRYYFMPRTPFNQSLKRLEFTRQNVLVKADSGVFKFEYKTNEEIRYINEKLDTISNNLKISTRRKFAREMSKKKIWLYYDCKGVAYDNGYLQFMHDVEKNDGVERFYISNNDFEAIKEYFPESLYEKIIQFGSEKHKRLVIACEKIITAYIEETNIYPFEAPEKKFYTDMFKFEVVYLQHGILHAHLPWKYTPERIDADRIVVSSYFEKENFKNIYKFREKDILPYGMPRFEVLDKNVETTNRILLAPSWRLYLVGENKSTGEWIYTPNKFVKSNFFIKMQEFLNDPKLHEMLEKHDMYLDFKLHPIFKKYQDCFELNSDRITFASNIVKDEEYAIFITDFSSFVFNFAYLQKPIMYFVPDYEEFTSGMNQYRELDLPFEKAFGPLTTDASSTVEELAKMLENSNQTDEKYMQRMKNFYLPMDASRENIYKALIQ